MKIDRDLVERVIHKQAETDHWVADLEFAYRQADTKADEILATVFLHSDGTVAERQAKAKVSEEYQQAKTAALKAELEWKKVKNKRQTGDNIIEVWRSLEASRRVGNI